MTWDLLSLRAIELLARGHSLYGTEQFDAGPANAPDQIRWRADRLVSVDREGMGAAAPVNVEMAGGLRRAAAADHKLAAALTDARTDHARAAKAADESSTTRSATRRRQPIPRSDGGKLCGAWSLACTSSGTISIARSATRICSRDG